MKHGDWMLIDEKTPQTISSIDVIQEADDKEGWYKIGNIYGYENGVLIERDVIKVYNQNIRLIYKGEDSRFLKYA